MLHRGHQAVVVGPGNVIDVDGAAAVGVAAGIRVCLPED